MPHVALLGDSILDNACYTKGGPDVGTQVRELLPEGWQATLLAVDGSTTEDIAAQVARIPSDATHLILSVGGNDAIMKSDLLLKPFDSTTKLLAKLADVSAEFESSYRRAVAACLTPQLPLTICTIYNGNFPDADYQRFARTALMVFNDVILRAAFEFALGVIDLRFVCSSAEDYANPIEPSSVGGLKIARCIVSAVSSSRECRPQVLVG